MVTTDPIRSIHFNANMKGPGTQLRQQAVECKRLVPDWEEVGKMLPKDSRKWLKDVESDVETSRHAPFMPSHRLGVKEFTCLVESRQ